MTTGMARGKYKSRHHQVHRPNLGQIKTNLVAVQIINQQFQQIRGAVLPDPDNSCL
jgi:hypothetical protein